MTYNPYFGFVEGHSHFSVEDLEEIRKLVGDESEEVISSYEKGFAKLIGDGEALSYASGRMAFYEVLRHLNLFKDDEIILLGFTCSVMVNAVLRAGLTPVFSDVDPDTFGSSVFSIEKLITPNTKVIVAQHSFGIPCQIEKIQRLAREKSIFLIEDCALSVGSKFKGIIVGNFGDVAIFSTDHSKPINTLIGGLVYSKDHTLMAKLRVSHKAIPQLSQTKKNAIWKRLLIERSFCNADKLKFLDIVDRFQSLKQRIFRTNSPFLDCDGDLPSDASYPYPAKLPTFLAALGLLEIMRWSKVEKSRINFLKSMLQIFEEKNLASILPKGYFDDNLSIVPLRFVWSPPEGDKLRITFSDFIKISWTWFMKPIIGTKISLEKMGYRTGTSPNSEFHSNRIMNLPCNIASQDMDVLLSKVRKALI